MVPMDTISEQYMKFTAPDKGLRVLCFVPEGNIPREQFMDVRMHHMPNTVLSHSSAARTNMSRLHA